MVAEMALVVAAMPVPKQEAPNLLGLREVEGFRLLGYNRVSLRSLKASKMHGDGTVSQEPISSERACGQTSVRQS